MMILDGGLLFWPPCTCTHVHLLRNLPLIVANVFVYRLIFFALFGLRYRLGENTGYIIFRLQQ